MLMRRIIVDAQAKFRRMVEEHSTTLPTQQQNGKSDPDDMGPTDPLITPSSLSIDINDATDATHNTISVDLKKISFLNTPTNSAESSPKDERRDESLNESDDAAARKPARSSPDRYGSVPKRRSSGESRQTTPESPRCSSSSSHHYETKDLSPNSDGAVSGARLGQRGTFNTVVRRLRLENERLQAEIARLRRLVVSGASRTDGDAKDPAELSSGDVSPSRVKALEVELQLAKEAISTLKADRKKLKTEKFDLLNQMKQLYVTIEEKEKELRDFIRNYDQMRDSETSLQQLTTEREERERERWSLLRHARDEAERSLSLAAQLNAKEIQLQQALEQLHETRRQLAVSGGSFSDQESIASVPRQSLNGDLCEGRAITPSLTPMGLLPINITVGSVERGSCSADSGVRVNSDRDSGGATSAGVTTPKDSSPTFSPISSSHFNRSMDSGVLSRSVEQLNSPVEYDSISAISRRSKPSHTRIPGGSRGGTWGSISRVFARSRHRSKTSSSSLDNESHFDPYRSWSPLTEEGYAEKLRLLREAASIPMDRWRAPTVLAWIEIALGMPQYGSRCAENIKSGKVLLELSDVDLEVGLGISHPMHRKKLRLAIEEHRNPNLIRYPCISQLGHTWVSSEWLPDLGLAQYGDNFATSLVDARMLEHLSKKELEKFLGVTRKFHQASVVHGIHLLRIMKYDRQALAIRRHQCENVDADPLVWTNQRFVRWARNIDLAEYAENLKDSGVHGGLVVLEPSFNGDTMATALGVPPSKSMIRRHLAAELEALIMPARAQLEHYIRSRGTTSSGKSHRHPGGSLGRSFSRSCAGSLPAAIAEGETRRSSIRGSISRAFGLVKNDRDKQSPTSSSENSSTVSRLSPTSSQTYQRCCSTSSAHAQHSSAASSCCESPIYAKPFANYRYSLGFTNHISEKAEIDSLYENPSLYDSSPSNSRLKFSPPNSTTSLIYNNDTPSKVSPGKSAEYMEGGSVGKDNFNNFLKEDARKVQHSRGKSICDMDAVIPSE